MALFGVVFTWVVFEHEPTYLRMQDDLYDCGISFRSLIVLASAGFLVNALMYYTKGLEELGNLNFMFVMLSKLIDPVMIYRFYRYVKSTLTFKGGLEGWADRGIRTLRKCSE